MSWKTKQSKIKFCQKIKKPKTKKKAEEGDRAVGLGVLIPLDLGVLVVPRTVCEPRHVAGMHSVPHTWEYEFQRILISLNSSPLSQFLSSLGFLFLA